MIRGPVKVDISVANQGELLNHPSNHPCCDSKCFFLWATLSLSHKTKPYSKSPQIHHIY